MLNHEYGERRHKKWSERSRGARIGIMAVAAVVFIPAFLTLFGAGTMWLWNWLMPAIFKLPTISFWQAIGILVLSHMLFKGNQFGKKGGRHWKKEKIRERMGEEAPEPKL